MLAVAGRTVEIVTPSGPAHVVLQVPTGAAGLMMIGHGAGGGIEAPDITAARDAALAAGVAVARVVQPYRVRGGRVPAPAHRLDEAWRAVTAALVRRPRLRSLPVLHAGRSSGARVACRCADDLGAVAVVALAFPLHPPGKPESSRLAELAAVKVPALVVQGSSDPFGCPPADAVSAPGRLVVIHGADHSLRRNSAAVRAAVGGFLADLGLALPPT
jgi:uncharacterized protein